MINHSASFTKFEELLKAIQKMKDNKEIEEFNFSGSYSNGQKNFTINWASDEEV